MGGRTTILVADATPALRDATASILSAAGYRVLEAGSPSEVLETVRRENPVLVLFDAALAEADLGEVREQIRSASGAVGALMVVVTGNSLSAEQQVEGLAAGVDGYVTRPFTRRELLARVAGFERVRRAEAELKRAEQDKEDLEIQLRQKQKLASMGTLARGVAHEINNPINGIMNFAQLIVDGLPEGHKLRDYAAEIIAEGERVADVTRNLLAFARGERQTASPARMTDIVENTLSLITALLRHDQIDLIADVPRDLPRVRCRSQQMQQVLMSLLTNARDALNERYPGYDRDKLIRISACAFDKGDGQWVRVTVEDHGVGIPIELQNRLFDPFFTTKKSSGGTGLGLSVGHSIVTDHDGELRVESEPGVGSRFHLELPAMVEGE